jgi:hypothetical protein
MIANQLGASNSSTLVRGGKPVPALGQLGPTGNWATRPAQARGIKPQGSYTQFARRRVSSQCEQRGARRDDINIDPPAFSDARHIAQICDGVGNTGFAYVGSDINVLALTGDPKGAQLFSCNFVYEATQPPGIYSRSVNCGLPCSSAHCRPAIPLRDYS